MIISLNGKSLVSDVQREFNLLFPFLKIELFRYPHATRQGSPRQTKLSNQLLLAELAGQLPEQISLSEQMTVQELEKMVEDQLGLHLQVFRKSGNLWLETTITDGWTLKQQNEHGMEISLAPVLTMIPPEEKERER